MLGKSSHLTQVKIQILSVLWMWNITYQQLIVDVGTLSHLLNLTKRQRDT